MEGMSLNTSKGSLLIEVPTDLLVYAALSAPKEPVDKFVTVDIDLMLEQMVPRVDLIH